MILRLDNFTLQYTEGRVTKTTNASDWAGFQKVYTVYQQQVALDLKNRNARDAYMATISGLNDQKARGVPMDNPPTKPLQELVDDQGNSLPPTPFYPSLPDPPVPYRTTTAGVGNIRNDNAPDPAAQFQGLVLDALHDLSTRLAAKGI